MLIRRFSECDDLSIEKIVTIDEKMIQKYGESFSEEKWGIENFLYWLPGKFENSLVLFDEQNIPIAYSINSIKNGHILYIHRFVSTCSGCADLVMREIIKSKSIYLLLVSTNNIPAINFYKRFGFHIITDLRFIEEIFPSNHNFITSSDDGCLKSKYLMKFEKL